MTNISPNSNDRLRIGLKKCLETIEALIPIVSCEQTRARLETKAAQARVEIDMVRDAA